MKKRTLQNIGEGILEVALLPIHFLVGRSMRDCIGENPPPTSPPPVLPGKRTKEEEIEAN
ncbi:MAG: hypothetical protein FWE31_00215 [Firmicutes bacterium]|nr:hypothetical protein [Bacillota bacterium]